MADINTDPFAAETPTTEPVKTEPITMEQFQSGLESTMRFLIEGISPGSDIEVAKKGSERAMNAFAQGDAVGMGIGLAEMIGGIGATVIPFSGPIRAGAKVAGKVADDVLDEALQAVKGGKLDAPFPAKKIKGLADEDDIRIPRKVQEIVDKGILNDKDKREVSDLIEEFNDTFSTDLGLGEILKQNKFNMSQAEAVGARVVAKQAVKGTPKQVDEVKTKFGNAPDELTPEAQKYVKGVFDQKIQKAIDTKELTEETSKLLMDQWGGGALSSAQLREALRNKGLMLNLEKQNFDLGFITATDMKTGKVRNLFFE